MAKDASGDGASFSTGEVSDADDGGGGTVAVESRLFFDGTIAPTDMDRATDAREKGRIGILGSGLSYGGSYSRVTSETIGRDLNPLGRGDGNAYVGGQLNLGRITPRLPMSTAPGGWGNSVNNGCGDGGGCAASAAVATRLPASSQAPKGRRLCTIDPVPDGESTDPSENPPKVLVGLPMSNMQSRVAISPVVGYDPPPSEDAPEEFPWEEQPRPGTRINDTQYYDEFKSARDKALDCLDDYHRQVKQEERLHPGTKYFPSSRLIECMRGKLLSSEILRLGYNGDCCEHLGELGKGPNPRQILGIYCCSDSDESHKGYYCSDGTILLCESLFSRTSSLSKVFADCQIAWTILHELVHACSKASLVFEFTHPGDYSIDNHAERAAYKILQCCFYCNEYAELYFDQNLHKKKEKEIYEPRMPPGHINPPRI
jgi:hypothetical protein